MRLELSREFKRFQLLYKISRRRKHKKRNYILQNIVNHSYFIISCSMLNISIYHAAIKTDKNYPI